MPFWVFVRKCQIYEWRIFEQKKLTKLSLTFAAKRWFLAVFWREKEEEEERERKKDRIGKKMIFRDFFAKNCRRHISAEFIHEENFAISIVCREKNFFFKILSTKILPPASCLSFSFVLMLGHKVDRNRNRLPGIGPASMPLSREEKTFWLRNEKEIKLDAPKRDLGTNKDNSAIVFAEKIFCVLRYNLE